MNLNTTSSRNFAVRNLECSRSGRRVFSGLSFRLESAELLHLRGANGSGKTSLLRMIAGLLPISSGEITRSVAFHYIGHRNALSTPLCARDMLRFWSGLMKGDKNFKADEVLNHWHLRDVASVPIAILSAGQARALSLCRLRLASRPLWLLDEPVAGLDHIRVDILRRQIKDHLALGGMVILAGHAHEALDIKGNVLNLDDI